MTTGAQLTVRCSIALASWIQRLPTAAAVRPAVCPGRSAPSHAIGARVQLVGHGVRTRRVRATLGPDTPVLDLTISGRRYLCSACGVAVQVLPADVMPWARYSLTAMARALGMVGAAGRSVGQVRHELGDGQNRDWPALRRWQRPLGSLCRLAPFQTSGTPHQRAQQIASWLLAYAPPWERERNVEQRVEIGATWTTTAPWRSLEAAPTRKHRVREITDILGDRSVSSSQPNDGIRLPRVPLRSSRRRRSFGRASSRQRAVKGLLRFLKTYDRTTRMNI